MWQVWLILAGIFVIVEMMTVGFLVFWLAIGSLVAMVVSIFAPSAIILQTAIFVIVSSILILFTRPLVNKYISNKSVPTNVEMLIGKKAKVILDINSIEGTGQVKVNGEVWSAKANTEEIIPKGTDVEILKIDGVKLLVKQYGVTAKFI